MKNKFLKIWKVVSHMPMFWVFVLLMAICMPTAILLPAENDVVVVCTGIGIDKADEGIELSLLTLIPQNSLTFADSYRLVSAKAKNIALATDKLINFLGKRVDFAHAAYVVFGNEICKDGITAIIEDFMRLNDIGTNATILTTNVTAKEMFETTKQFDTNSGEKVKDILYNNKRSLMDVNTSIDRFYNNYLSQSSCSIANMIKLVDSQGEGVEATNQNGVAEGDEGTGGGSSSNTKKVSMMAQVQFLKKRKKLWTLRWNKPKH